MPWNIHLLGVWPNVSACVLKGREEEIVIVGRFEGSFISVLAFYTAFCRAYACEV